MALPNDHSNPACDVDEDTEDQPIMHISVNSLEKEFFDKIRHSYSDNTDTVKLIEILGKDPDTGLMSTLTEPWKTEYSHGRFNLEDGLIYHREKYSGVLCHPVAQVYKLGLLECAMG